MRLKKTLFLIFFCIIIDNSLSYSQIAGESTYQFLNIPSSPRHLALGGKNVTIQDDDVVSEESAKLIMVFSTYKYMG